MTVIDFIQQFIPDAEVSQKELPAASWLRCCYAAKVSATRVKSTAIAGYTPLPECESNY